MGALTFAVESLLSTNQERTRLARGVRRFAEHPWALATRTFWFGFHALLASERALGHSGAVTDNLWIRGRPIQASDVAQVQAWRRAHPEWSRRRLSEELVGLWNWRTPAGQLKDIATRDVLNRLEARGLLDLPPRQRRGGRQRPRAMQAQTQGP